MNGKSLMNDSDMNSFFPCEKYEIPQLFVIIDTFNFNFQLFSRDSVESHKLINSSAKVTNGTITHSVNSPITGRENYPSVLQYHRFAPPSKQERKRDLNAASKALGISSLTYITFYVLVFCNKYQVVA